MPQQKRVWKGGESGPVDVVDVEAPVVQLHPQHSSVQFWSRTPPVNLGAYGTSFTRSLFSQEEAGGIEGCYVFFSV